MESIFFLNKRIFLRFFAPKEDLIDSTDFFRIQSKSKFFAKTVNFVQPLTINALS